LDPFNVAFLQETSSRFAGFPIYLSLSPLPLIPDSETREERRRAKSACCV